nr:BrnA antitoxin family protein [Rhizobium gei]
MIGPDPEIERPLSAHEAGKAKPFREAFPDLAASIDRTRKGRPPIDNPKEQISIRLSPDVIQAFKATGKGWQTRIDDALRKAVGL